ncbi:MAG: type II toxin-antitoxin system RelE/ParE family toxin, partial [Desulfobulbaceae bacterium]|nr:type II toxin-antitoxin system RelE/ParE family toxin [Desulfobulbaceae bacterium]
EIGHYTKERWGREQRNLYLTMLDASFQQLAVNPLEGKDCSDIRNGYRKLNTGSYIMTLSSKVRGFNRDCSYSARTYGFDSRLSEP